MVEKSRKKLANYTTEEIKQFLCNKPYTSPNKVTPNFLLIELKLRGEDITEFIDVVLYMLESKSNLFRVFGFGALRSVFPDIAVMIKSYHPEHSYESCKEEISKLRVILHNNNNINDKSTDH
jgi:hypothetical protein